MIWLIGNRGMLGTEVEALLCKWNMPFIASDKEVDITDSVQLQKFVADNPLSWIINCSAYTAVDKAEDEPELAFRINADGPRNIAEIAGNKGAKLIHISTDYVFDGAKEGAYVETDSPHPLSVYGKSKYQGEIHIQKTLKEHFILRTSWLYGKHGNNFVHTILNLCKKKEVLYVVNDQFGSPTFAFDLATAIVIMVQLKVKVFGIYHFTNEGLISWYDFACQIRNQGHENNILKKYASILPISTTEYPQKAMRPPHAWLSKDKIKHFFDIHVRSWQEGLRDYFSA